MGKKNYAYVISVYKFMRCCGLECDMKPNVMISHNIMMKKLSLRHQKMPDKVIMPTRTTCEKAKNDDIKTGKVVLVEDDYGTKLPYYMPNYVISLEEVSQEELAKRREKALKEASLEVKEPSLGLQRYIKRKQKKLELEKQKKALKEQKFNLEEYPNLKKRK